jgi:hypothetical protein
MHTQPPTPHDAPATRRPAARRRPLRALGALAVAGALALSACGDDDDDADPGQPVASGGFDAGAMADVPVPDAAQASGAASTSGSTTTQSYLVDGVDPQQLITTYQQLATTAGWTVQTAPAQSDTDWSMTLTKDSDTLQVTTAPAGDEDQSDQTELSLQLTAGS